MKNFLHNKYRILIFIFCFFLVFSIIFLKKIEPTLENKQFEHFTDSIFTSELSSNTLNLHYTLAHPEKFGIKDYKISLGSMNEKAHSNSFSKLKSNQKRLKNFHYQKLSKENQLTYDILSLEFSTQLSGENFFWLQEPLSPHLGILPSFRFCLPNTPSAQETISKTIFLCSPASPTIITNWQNLNFKKRNVDSL